MKHRVFNVCIHEVLVISKGFERMPLQKKQLFIPIYIGIICSSDITTIET